MIAATALVAGVGTVLLFEQLRDEGARKPTAKHATAADSRCGLSVARGDFDGDGRQDVASVYAAISPGRSCDLEHASGRFVLRVKLGTGAMTDLLLGKLDANTQPPCLELCVALDAPDVDRDGRSEVAVELGRGASEAWFALIRLETDRLEPFVVESREGSRLAEFRLFGSLGHGGDFVCRTAKSGAPLVVQSSYGLTARDQIAFRETVYAVDGSVLRPRAPHEETRPVPDHYPPKLAGRPCLVPNERLLGTDPRRT